MRFADAIATQQSRVEARADDLGAQTFARALPAELRRATILDATSVHDFLLPNSASKLAQVPNLAVTPPWHISFVEMCMHKAFGLYAGVLILRESDQILASLVLGNQFKSIRAANFKTSFDPKTGTLLGETIIATPPEFSDKAKPFLSAFAVALYAFAFANCKNVDVLPDDQPRNQRRRFEKKHGFAPLVYHVLDIRPLCKRVQSEPGEGTEVERALHICRGHFRTYTEQRKLFGRVAGTFWIDEHARGSADNGTVVKDYRIAEAA